MDGLFTLRGRLSRRATTLLGIGGVFFILLIWHLITMGEHPLIGQGVMPTPWSVMMAYGELIRDNDLILNTFRSLGVNLAGYVEALLISIPLGFVIGLIPLFRGAFQRPVDAMRYVPLTAVTGLFIAWFGIGLDMKTHFLAFGIIIYLLPIIVQRIDEVQDVYLKTVYTLGASRWQTIKSVYMPSVLSRLWDDVRILTAISWTYIIVAETINNQGGLGSVIWFAGQRFRRYDKVFAVLILIMVVGVIQDKVFSYLDKKLFPHKYQVRDQDMKGQNIGEPLGARLGRFALEIFIYILLASYVLMALDEVLGILGVRALSYLFGETVWAVHVIFLSIIGHIIYKYYIGRK